MTGSYHSLPNRLLQPSQFCGALVKVRVLAALLVGLERESENGFLEFIRYFNVQLSIKSKSKHKEASQRYCDKNNSKQVSFLLIGGGSVGYQDTSEKDSSFTD